MQARARWMAVAVAPVVLGAAAWGQGPLLPFQLNADGGATGGVALAVSDAGVAVGGGSPPAGGFTQPAAWSAGGTTLLPLLPDHEYGFAYGVGEDGTVLGESDDVVMQGQLLFFFPEAVIWQEGVPARVADLVTGGATYIDPFEALRTDAQGRILGIGRIEADLALRGFVLETDGTMVDLGSLTGPSGRSEPFDWNEQGVVVGASEVSGFDHAFLWEDGVMVDLHDPKVILGQNSHARAINEWGVVVGSADFVPGGIQFETAAMWVDGVATDLGTLGGSQGYARAINEHGTVVGTATTGVPGEVHAFVYRDGVMTDLNDLIPPDSGWVLANAYDVTNDGRIVGDGFLDGGVHPYVAVPDCGGGFQVYGAGCPGSGGFVPRLSGEGCPAPGEELSLALVGGLGGAPGLLLLGTGTGVLPLLPGCDLQVLPLAPAQLFFALQGEGAGAGAWQLPLSLPPAFPATTLNLQAVLGDPGAAGGLTVTNALEMEVR